MQLSAHERLQRSAGVADGEKRHAVAVCPAQALWARSYFCVHVLQLPLCAVQ
jgi:hypothetical protein